MNNLHLYGRYLQMGFKSNLQYKGWPVQVLQTVFFVITDPIGVLLLFGRFGSIGVWSVERILLIYALAVTSFGLAELLSRGFDLFPWRMIRSGDFDRILLRPRPLFVQLAGSFFHVSRLSRVTGGLVVIGWSLAKQGVVLSLGKVLMLVFAMLGGYFAYTGVFVLTSGIAFFTIQGLDWIYIFTNASYQLTQAPPEYLPRWLRNTFTFFMPMFVVSYYPAAVVSGWGEARWKGWLALPAGLAFLLFATLVWRFGVRHYRSTGS